MGQVRFPPPWTTFPKVSSTNYIADLSILKQCVNSEQYNSFKHIVRYLQRHPLHYALTASPKVMYSEMLKEFWTTCEYHPSENYIRGYVCSGKNLIRVTITITIQRTKRYSQAGPDEYGI
ncbi:hypothetical protein CTI12_AA546110 [Artemisia annua]|uniref:Uncharacterized protein n=1 Tax=Artemisia annua TaxID=35608 RepID=A0A2U1KZW7_ARTAN|nr:hypothetical protein CTI12_AA546110 [Artemisia annua]